jgi:hypothetical protein
VICALNKSPLAILDIAGAETLDMFSTKDDAFNLFTTATIKSSNPARLPWLSKAGTQINILKLANGATLIWSLFDGTKYGSPGVITMLLGIKVAGGKLKIFQTPVFVRSVANVDLSVVIAVVINRPVC